MARLHMDQPSDTENLQLLDTEGVRLHQHGRVRVVSITSSLCVVGLILMTGVILAVLPHSHLQFSSHFISGLMEKDNTYTFKGDVIGDGNTIQSKVDKSITTRDGQVNDHSKKNLQQLKSDGVAGIGVKQLKICEGSGNDGSGAGAVGTVCCASPKGHVQCKSAASGGQAINEQWDGPKLNGQCQMEGQNTGKCKCKWPSGTWEGHCKNGKKDGNGTLILKDGTKSLVEYNDDCPVAVMKANKKSERIFCHTPKTFL